MEEFFYDNGGIIAYTRPALIQTALDVLTELLNRVGLQTNLNKNVGIVRQT